MKTYRVQKFGKIFPDPTGAAIAVRFFDLDGHEVQVELLVKQANALVANLAIAGLATAKQHNDPAHPHDGEEFVITTPATYADATIGPESQTIVTIGLGRIAVAATLTPEQALDLGRQLLQVAGTPPPAATH